MIIIGRKDRIDLPELEIFDLEAKIDTGAYGSALHCHRFEVINKDGQEMLSYMVLDPSHPEYNNKMLLAKEFSYKIVKSSNGSEEKRYTIITAVRIFGEEFSTEFSLTDRNEMKYPVLLGRKFLSNRFLVNVKLKDISHKTLNKKP